MGSTKAVMCPRHMACLETSLGMVYVQNSRIQARSGGKPPFHLDWQLELVWKKLWTVSSFAHRNLCSISAAAHWEHWLWTGFLPARSSCSCNSCLPACKATARKQPSFPRKGKVNAQASRQYLPRTLPVPAGPHQMQDSSPCGTESRVVLITKSICLTAGICSLSGVTKQNHLYEETKSCIFNAVSKVKNVFLLFSLCKCTSQESPRYKKP